MSLVLSGPVLGVLHKEGRTDKGREWKMTTVAIQHGLGSLFVTLRDEMEEPGEGEIVAYEVRAKAVARDDGTAAIYWTAVSVAALPALTGR